MLPDRGDQPGDQDVPIQALRRRWSGFGTAQLNDPGLDLAIVRIDANLIDMPPAIASTEGVILSRVLRPEEGNLPPEAARWLLRVDFDDADRARIAELYEKAREGTLSEVEDAELEDYGDVGRMLEILRAKARATLANSEQ